MDRSLIVKKVVKKSKKYSPIGGNRKDSLKLDIKYLEHKLKEIMKIYRQKKIELDEIIADECIDDILRGNDEEDI